jgi:N utilization substance protein B
MGQRRKARELAIQFFYQLDATGEDQSVAEERFKASFGLPDRSAAFFRRLVDGVIAEREDLDALIKRFSRHWRFDRMSRVDRNILRLAVYEMVHCEDIPVKVSINEAVELGKKFGTETSGAFINGILDAIREHLASQEAKE